MQVNNCDCSQRLQASSVCVNKISLCTGVGGRPSKQNMQILAYVPSLSLHTHTNTTPQTDIHTCTDTRAHTHKTDIHKHTYSNPHSSELCMMFIILCRHIPFSKLSQLSKHMLLVHSSGGRDSTQSAVGCGRM